MKALAPALFGLLLLLASCRSDGTGVGAGAELSGDGGYRRIVSLDYCADQYVLALADRASVKALSPDARKSFSFMRAEAEGLPQVAPRVEDVLLLKPDLVVRAYGGGPGAEDAFRRAGVPVLQVGWADDLPGVRQVLADMADGMGRRAEGARLLADFDARLAAVIQSGGGRRALYFTAGGVTSGPGTLIDEMFRAAGYGNFEEEPGWRTLPLERLAREEPDLVVPAFFATETQNQDAWSAARHPIARRQLKGHPVVPVESAWTACGGWYVVNAIETLAAAGGGPVQ